MGNIAELIMRNPTPENIQQAKSWANMGLNVIKVTRKDTFLKHEICEAAYAVMLYNVAMVREVRMFIRLQNSTLTSLQLSGDKQKAQDLLTESLDHSKTIGFNDGIKHAEEALNKVKDAADNISPLPVTFEKVDY